MKLIIDIDEEEYKCLDYYQAINQPIFKAIKNGIPLDDIITEIADEKTDYYRRLKTIMNNAYIWFCPDCGARMITVQKEGD